MFTVSKTFTVHICVTEDRNWISYVGSKYAIELQNLAVYMYVHMSELYLSLCANLMFFCILCIRTVVILESVWRGGYISFTIIHICCTVTRSSLIHFFIEIHSRSSYKFPPKLLWSWSYRSTLYAPFFVSTLEGTQDMNLLFCKCPLFRLKQNLTWFSRCLNKLYNDTSPHKWTCSVSSQNKILKKSKAHSN